jgi:hypothetical protein
MDQVDWVRQKVQLEARSVREASQAGHSPTRRSIGRRRRAWRSAGLDGRRSRPMAPRGSGRRGLSLTGWQTAVHGLDPQLRG